MSKPSSLSNSQFFLNWIRRVIPNPQAIALAVLLIVGFFLVATLSDMLLPVFAAGVFAYLLQGIVAFGEREDIPRFTVVLVVYSAFLAFLTFILIALLPLLYQQTVQLIQQLPAMVNRAQDVVLQLPEIYPSWFTEAQVLDIIAGVREAIISYGRDLLSISISSVVGIITLIVYLILVPLLIFFFLKDKEKILHWFVQFLPRDIHLSARVWREVDIQIGNYIRGKFVEVIMLGVVSYVTFALMGLNYSVLLGVLMGLSVIIPYVGATLVTFPVTIVAYTQWGLTEDFAWIMVAYAIMQTCDGAILVPLLFSEAVNLHPVAIIVAILFFGGLWGFWGVFFAIPLATLVQAVLTAWPSHDDEESEMADESVSGDESIVQPPSSISQ